MISLILVSRQMRGLNNLHLLRSVDFFRFAPIAAIKAEKHGVPLD